MRNLITLIIVLAFSFQGYGQTKSAQISFSEELHNFGTIKEEAGKVTAKFEFVNTGGSSLIVQNVRPTCGCTTPGWTKQPIPPGGKGYVEATFDPNGRPNAFTKYLYVDSNADTKTVRLTIKGEVTPKTLTVEDIYSYEMGPLRLKKNHMAFGNINNTETKEQKIEVINTSDKKITVNFEDIPRSVTIRCEPAVLNPNQTGYIVADFDASKRGDWGIVYDRVNILIDGVSERNYRLVCSGNIVEDFSGMTEEELANAPVVKVDNQEVDFGTMKQREKFEHDFIISNAGNSTLYLRKVKASCGCTAVQPEKNKIEPGESVKIKAIFNSGGYRGNQSKSITVITNDPKRSSVILRIKGVVEVS